jgi:hypothetical protein
MSGVVTPQPNYAPGQTLLVGSPASGPAFTWAAVLHSVAADGLLVALPASAAESWPGSDIHAVPDSLNEQFLDIILSQVPASAVYEYDAEELSEERVRDFWSTPEHVPFGLSSEHVGYPLWPAFSDLPGLTTAALPPRASGQGSFDDDFMSADQVPFTPSGLELPPAGRGAGVHRSPAEIDPPPGGRGGGGRGSGGGRNATSRPPSLATQVAAMTEAFQSQTRALERLMQQNSAGPSQPQASFGVSPYQTVSSLHPQPDLAALASEAGPGPTSARGQLALPPGLQQHSPPWGPAQPAQSQAASSGAVPASEPRDADMLRALGWTNPLRRAGAGIPPGLRSNLANSGPAQTPQPPSIPTASGPAASQSDALTSVLQSQAIMLQQLLSRQSPHPASGQDAIGGILSGGPDGTEEDGGLRMPGARGAAAKEAFRQEVLRRPLGIARAIYGNMSESLTADPWDPNAHGGPSMRTFFSRETAFGQYKTLAYLGWVLATAFDWMMAGDAYKDKVKCLLGLACAAVDQVCIDGGSWHLAWHLLCLPEPPWAYISRSYPAGGHPPFTKLADPKWTAAILGYLKDVETFNGSKQHRRQQFGDSGAAAPKQPPTAKPPRGGAKGGAAQGPAAPSS